MAYSITYYVNMRVFPPISVAYHVCVLSLSFILEYKLSVRDSRSDRGFASGIRKKIADGTENQHRKR